MDVLIRDGIDALPTKIGITLGAPFAPMLAHPVKGPSCSPINLSDLQEVFDRLDKKTFTAEWKYDGERAQIHLTEEGKVFVFSRNLENTTEKFPDIAHSLPKAVAKVL